MNDLILNWRKINKLLPYGSSNAADEAYTREQIKKMLEIQILEPKFLYSSWHRVECDWGVLLALLMEIYTLSLMKVTGKKLVAAHVVVYRGTDDEYDTFIRLRLSLYTKNIEIFA